MNMNSKQNVFSGLKIAFVISISCLSLSAWSVDKASPAEEFVNYMFLSQTDKKNPENNYKVVVCDKDKIKAYRIKNFDFVGGNTFLLQPFTTSGGNVQIGAIRNFLFTSNSPILLVPGKTLQSTIDSDNGYLRLALDKGSAPEVKFIKQGVEFTHDAKNATHVDRGGFTSEVDNPAVVRFYQLQKQRGYALVIRPTKITNNQPVEVLTQSNCPKGIKRDVLNR